MLSGGPAERAGHCTTDHTKVAVPETPSVSESACAPGGTVTLLPRACWSVLDLRTPFLPADCARNGAARPCALAVGGYATGVGATACKADDVCAAASWEGAAQGPAGPVALVRARVASSDRASAIVRRRAVPSAAGHRPERSNSMRASMSANSDGDSAGRSGAAHDYKASKYAARTRCPARPTSLSCRISDWTARSHPGDREHAPGLGIALVVVGNRVEGEDQPGHGGLGAGVPGEDVGDVLAAAPGGRRAPDITGQSRHGPAGRTSDS